MNEVIIIKMNQLHKKVKCAEIGEDIIAGARLQGPALRAVSKTKYFKTNCAISPISCATGRCRFTPDSKKEMKTSL